MILLVAVLISGCVGNENATSGVDQVTPGQNSVNESNATESLNGSNTTGSLNESNTTESLNVSSTTGSLNESNLAESLDEVGIGNESGSTKMDSFELYNGSISEGDGYQINDYVLDVTNAIPDTGTASFEVYNNGTKVDSFIINEGEHYAFNFEDASTIEVALMSVKSGVFPVVQISIIVTDYDRNGIYKSGVIDGGHEYA
jgi:hypothetical protein